jgi:hypothetical protein
MMLGISEALDGQLVLLVGVLIVLGTTANVFLSSRIKRDTGQVNKAVNHVAEGTPTLSDRVDAVNGTLEYTQAVLTVYKKDTAEQFENIHKSQDELRGMIEVVKDDVAKIRESVDRRKIDRGNDVS